MKKMIWGERKKWVWMCWLEPKAAKEGAAQSHCAAETANRGRQGGVSMGLLLCSSRTDAFPYLLPGEKQTLAAHMKGSFPGSIWAAKRSNRALIEFERERGRKVHDWHAVCAESRSICAWRVVSKPSQKMLSFSASLKENRLTYAEIVKPDWYFGWPTLSADICLSEINRYWHTRYQFG